VEQQALLVAGAEAGLVGVLCQVGERIDDGRPALERYPGGDPGSIPEELRAPLVVGGRALILTEPGSGGGRLRQPGQPGSLAIRWTDAQGGLTRCDEFGTTWSGVAVVEGRVVDEGGSAVAGAAVEGCGGETSTDDQGAFVAIVDAGPCALRARVGETWGPELPLHAAADVRSVGAELRVTQPR